MRDFLDQDFLLKTETAKQLYHKHAAKMPIIDYHCHIIPQQIVENTKFENITQAWLGADHYKWRLMRAMGVAEEFVTGNASDRDKFQKFAEILPACIGNPIHHWSHLELRRYFGCDLIINGENAQAIWDHTAQVLEREDMRVRGLIAQSNVSFIGTTDDPIDDLKWHKILQEDETFAPIIAPTFRPDKAINIDKPGFAQYIAKLAEVSATPISSVKDLKAALVERIDFFHATGCKASDHGLDYVTFNLADAETVEKIFQKGLSGDAVTQAEADILKTDMMLFFGREFFKRSWVMQLHYGCLRNNNEKKFQSIGPDAGFDAIGMQDCSLATSRFLNALEQEGALPKTILYSLNPNDNAALATIIGCFQDGQSVGKMQHGSAWWFNDTKRGMEEQMMQLADVGVLGAFIGMLTDSRSFLSYTRHEYFRRILCNLLGEWVENGEYPADMKDLGKIVEGVSYNNAKAYFGL